MLIHYFERKSFRYDERNKTETDNNTDIEILRINQKRYLKEISILFFSWKTLKTR